MDAIVLAPMPQNPAQTHGQSGQTTGRNDSSFGPVLSQAIAGNGTDRKSSPESPSRHGSTSDSDQAIGIESIDEFSELNAFLAANNLTLEELPQDLREMIASVYGHPAHAARADGSVSGEMAMLPPGMVIFPKAQLPRGMDAFLEKQLAEGATMPQLPADLYIQKKELTLILSQLQQIIEVNESRSVVVQQVPANTVTLDELAGLTPRLPAGEGSFQTGQAGKDSATGQPVHVLQSEKAHATISAAGPATETSRSNIQATGLTGLTGQTETAADSPSTPLRQEMQQVTDARVMLATDDRNQTGRQPGQQENNAATQQATSAAQSNSGSQPDQPLQTGIFSIVLQESTAPQQPQGHGSIVTLPSGTLVNEQEVINQVMQRFQLTAHLQSSKINIKLHPAELGELKIDLTVREGTIKASVFAQNQHAQEILERNMPKLRSVLEQQGFTIEEIVVSFKPETAKEFDLFDGRSTQGRQYTYSGSSGSSSATFESALDSSLAGTAIPDSGLNIRA